MRKHQSIAAVLVTLGVAAAGAGYAEETASPHAAEVLSAMDRSADPCQDFYRYACGGWLDATELPADQVRWARSFSVIRERNREMLREILEAAASGTGENGAAPIDPDRRRIGHFYASCMDEPAVEKAGTKPLAPLLREIAEVDGTQDAFRLAGKLGRVGIDPFFGIGVVPDFRNPEIEIAFFSQGGLGLPDRDYYISDDPKKRDLLKRYEVHVAEMFELLGEEPETAAGRASRVVSFETALAEASRPRAEMRIPEKLYNRLDLKGLQKLTPNLPWKRYLAALDHPKIRDINVATPEFFTALEKAVAAADAEALRAYLTWHLMHGTADLLPKAFVDATFDFYGAALGGQQEMEPRWKRCVDATEAAFGEAVGKLYVERAFAGDSKEQALEMIHGVEEAFQATLPELAWMDDATRARALEKLATLENKIGYPDRWRDYSRVTVAPGDYFANAIAARQFEVDRELTKIGKPVDPNEWGMYPQEVNAYYSPLRNEIVFPAGILQPPFFHREFPAAMSYGAIGAVVGHELTHGFDDQGRKFDPKGRLSEWWEPAVSEKFEQRAACVRDLYSTYEVEPGLNVQGDLTLGENIADLGGLKQSYRAFQAHEAGMNGAAPSEPAVPGLTDDQLFFVAYAQVWCALQTPEIQRLRLTVDTHSPPRFRVIGPISNHPAFAPAFGCEEGTPMRPKMMCEVW